VNRNHVRNDTLSRQLLYCCKLPTLKLFRGLLDQTGLTVTWWLLLLLLHTSKLAHIHCLSYDVILLENESRLLLLVLLNLLHRSTDISIHLQAIHNLTEVLLLHWQLARGPLLVCDTWFLRLCVLQMLSNALWIQKLLHHVLSGYCLGVVLGCICMNIVVYRINALIVYGFRVPKTLRLVACKFRMAKYLCFQLCFRPEFNRRKVINDLSDLSMSSRLSSGWS